MSACRRALDRIKAVLTRSYTAVANFTEAVISVFIGIPVLVIAYWIFALCLCVQGDWIVLWPVIVFVALLLCMWLISKVVNRGTEDEAERNTEGEANTDSESGDTIERPASDAIAEAAASVERTVKSLVS